MKLKLIVSLSAIFLYGCSSSPKGSVSPMENPSDLKISTKTFTFNTRSTQLGFLPDRLSGVISVYDLGRNALVDTDTEDDYDHTPIIAGGELVALAIDDRGAKTRVFVVDARDKLLMGFEASDPSVLPRENISFNPIDLGGALQGRFTRPQFFNSGVPSEPLVSGISVSSSAAVSEFWKFNFINRTAGYAVKSSKQGALPNTVPEGTVFNESGVSLTIQSGVQRTDGGDHFYFGTTTLKPHALSGTPKDLLVSGNKLVVLTDSPSEVVVFNLDTLTVDSTLTLTDGQVPVLGRGVLFNQTLYVPNQLNGNVFQVDLNTNTFSVINTGVKSSFLDITLDGAELLLPHISDTKVSFYNLVGANVTSSVRTSDYPTASSIFEYAGQNYALISERGNLIDVINLTTKQRFDASDSASNESTVGAVQFYDTGSKSDPYFLSAKAIEGLAATERWQAVYEGYVPDAIDLPASISGDSLTLTLANFNLLKVVAGDTLEITQGGSVVEVKVAAITSSTNATLNTTSTLQGAVTISAKASGSYVVLGTVSGTQSNRLFENIKYVSDSGALELIIQSSLSLPVTRGDYFSFSVFDGINARSLSFAGSSGVSRVVVPPGETKKIAYVVREIAGAISLINLDNFTQRSFVR